jgi:hypothetical protein
MGNEWLRLRATRRQQGDAVGDVPDVLTILKFDP